MYTASGGVHVTSVLVKCDSFIFFFPENLMYVHVYPACFHQASAVSQCLPHKKVLCFGCFKRSCLTVLTIC